MAFVKTLKMYDYKSLRCSAFKENKLSNYFPNLFTPF